MSLRTPDILIRRRPQRIFRETAARRKRRASAPFIRFARSFGRIRDSHSRARCSSRMIHRGEGKERKKKEKEIESLRMVLLFDAD